MSAPRPTLQIVYGYGKGKTTSATGLALAAAGAGRRVAVVYFDKGYDGQTEHYSERHVLRALDAVEIFPTGCERMRDDGTFRFGVEPEDEAEAARGLTIARERIESGAQDLLVLDEALAAVAYKLVKRETIDGLVDLWEERGRPCDLVITGHQLWDELRKRADRVVESKKVKHYFDAGLQARLGIEI